MSKRDSSPTRTVSKSSKVPQQFKNLNELVDYLETVEQRLESLEIENRRLKKITKSQAKDINKDLDFVYNILPVTNLINASFLKRAFAVWGHFFVSNLFISIVAGIVYACVATILFGSIFGSFLQNMP